MATEVLMPRLSDSMEEATILGWLKSVGDELAVGDDLVEIETDKANMVYEADVAGTLLEITAEEGATVRLGDVIARVGAAGEAPPQPQAAAEHRPDAATAANGGSAARPAASRSEAAVSVSADGTRVKASPLARRIAASAGVDLAGLSGSGPGGRITKVDVERAAASGSAPAPATSAPLSADPGQAPSPKPGSDPSVAKGEVEVVELNKIQQTIARRMSESKATAPHFYLEAEIDMSRCVEARAGLKAVAGDDETVPSYNDMVVKACGIALTEFPRANGSYRDGRLELYSRVNIGIAVATRDALVVPTVFDVDSRGLRDIASESRRLAARVREGSISPSELSGGTFTVSNLGMYGVTNFHAVINTPQAAILAVGAIVERAVVRDGQLAVAPVMGVTLACDHRILYGAQGAEFLARVRALLEEPFGLAL